MPLSLARLTLIGSTLAVALGHAVAQTPSAANAAASQPSTAIAVPPQKAAEAADKAVPRSDVATLVKTGPTAADKAHDATGSAKRAAHRAKHPHHAASAASAAGSQ